MLGRGKHASGLERQQAALSPGSILVVALAAAIGALGVVMAIAPRLVRRVVRRRQLSRNMRDELLMPGALLSMRVMGATLTAMALLILASGGRLPV
jgi:hypothetical protein